MLSVYMPEAPSATIMSLVRAGSEYETKEKNGISHFLEHMCFKGTEKRPKSIDISRELDGMGAQSNAFTGNEYTGYWAKAHPKNFKKILDIIADMYLHPTFPEAEIEKEKGVIIEEINMYEDLPQRKVGEVFNELLYGDTPFGRSIAGPIFNIKKMKRDDFVNYRKDRYVAENTLIVVAGNIKPQTMFKEVEKSFKEIPVGKSISKQKFSEKQDTPRLKIEKKKTDQTHLVLGVRAFDIFDKRIPAADVLSVILGQGMSSRLWQKMREELGICYYVRAGVDSFTDHGNFYVSAGVNKDRIIEAVRGILDEMKKVIAEKISPEELRKTKDFMIGNLYLGLESSDSLAGFYGSQAITKEKIKNPKEKEAEIEKVTAVDIQNLAKQIFVTKNLNLAIVGQVKNQVSLKKILHF